MGSGYTRNDTPNNIADGNVINASDLDGEFDAVQAAFNGSTGHSHDGTSGEGPQIDTGGLADDAVTNAKLAANSVDSDQYVDGSIDRVHLAADIVDGTKIADDVINSEHYVAGSIDAEHLASSSVTAAKVANDAVALGTKTSGNYVATIATSAGLDGSASSEGATPTISLNLNELTTSTTDGDGDYFVVVDTAGTQRKLTKANIAVSGFNTANGIALGTDTTGNYIATGAVSGVGLSGSASAEGATFTVTSNATDANTASTIVARDASGNFSAGTVTAALTGNADTATALETARTIAGNSFDGTANITIASTDLSDAASINATTLDSIDSTSFLRSDAADTKTSGDLSFSDSVKAIFGAGSDLQIYHDGTNSFIDDAGTGNLLIRSNRTIIQKYTGEVAGDFVADGEAALYYDNAKKLATTATGVDVTGTVTADGLDVDNLRLDGNTISSTDTNGDITLDPDGTGDTVMTGPASATPVTNAVARILTTGSNPPTGNGGGLVFTQVNSGGTNQDYASITGSRVDSTANNKVDLVISTGDPTGGTAIAERVRVDTSGNVGIGTTSPATTLHVSGGAMLDGVTVIGRNQTSYDSAGAEVLIDADSGTPPMIWHVGGSEVARIQAAGGISFNGDTAAANALDDYEEGTWTATLGGTTTNPSTAVTVTGTYIKVGRLVWADALFSNVNTTGASGGVQVTGMPYNSDRTNPTGNVMAHTLFDTTATASANNITPFFVSGTAVQFYQTFDGGGWAAVTHFGSGAGRYLYFSLTYRTA